MHESFNHFLTTGLNESQKKAVIHESGPVLVVAGAGSGKTRVITARITHLIINKLLPGSSIIALTFTNKAANEMKERIASFLGSHADLPFVGTFHAYCVQILKKYNAHLRTPFTAILDSDDQQKMILAILNRSGLQKQFTPKSVAHYISQMKQTIDGNATSTSFAPHPMLTQICNAYETEKRASQCLDFDDLLLETFKLLKNNSVVKKQFQEKIQHILVDEYQDTNIVQHELLKIMALDENKQLAIQSLCAVGDEDQSIYSWRGATVANMN